MLELSQETGGWSFEWSRAHFGAWCIMSSPLILGLDLLSSVQMEQMWPIISNAEAIAVNQQWAGHAGWLVQSWTPDGAAKITERGDTPGCGHGNVVCWEEPLDVGQVWCKPQPAGAVAVWVLNNSPHSELPYSVALSELELRESSLFMVRDIWAGTSLVPIISERLHGTVAPMDSHLLLLSPLDPPPSPPSPPRPPFVPPPPNPSQPPLNPPPPSPPPPPPSPPPQPPPPAPPVPPPFAPPLPPMPPPPLAPPSAPPSALAILHLAAAPPLALAAIGLLLLTNAALLCWWCASRHRQQLRRGGHVSDRSPRSSRGPASTRRARGSSKGPTPPVRAVRQQRPVGGEAPRRKSRRRSEGRALDEVRLVHATSEADDVEGDRATDEPSAGRRKSGRRR